MCTCMHAVNFCKLTFEHYIFLEHSPNFKRIVIYRRRESTLVAFSKNWLTSIFCLKTAYFFKLRGWCVGARFTGWIVHRRQPEGGQGRSVTGLAIFVHTPFYRARSLSLQDYFYTGQSPDVLPGLTVFILASLQMCTIHMPLSAGGGGGAGWWEGGCGGEGWGCRRGKARVHRCCWLWRLANGGGCMRRSVWLLQTCGPPTLKSKRGGQLVGAYLVASRGLPSRSTAPGSLSPPALHWFPRACTSHHPSSWLQFPVFASMRRPFFAFFLYSCFIASRCYSQEEMNFSTASEISFSALSLWWDMSGSVFPLSAVTVFDDTVPAPPVPS